MDLQVEKNHYFNRRYNHKARWLSYWYQIDLALEIDARSVLEVGIGNGIVKDYLKKAGKSVLALDIDKGLEPDFVGSVEKIPMEGETVDCVLAAEVLEHLPFEKFDACLKEMARVSKKWAIISLPDARRTLCNFYLKKPFLPPLKLFLKMPAMKAHKFDGQHYWEPGRRRYPLKRVESRIKATGWKIEKSFTPYDVPTKHFYLLKK
ncbi:MAG: methyltransferase type 11 [Parcubacteria group bacterium CG10_big_fil_rev_8_21_14_0_10_36_14]|nr:MAG: methyltransferase type 11 [Parcubacteria group bacterium CG10_big_fil_rev_8_21_14_0_10_36_14]